METFLDEKLADFVSDFPQQHQNAVVNVFFQNVSDIIKYCLERMSPADAIKYIQTKPYMLFEEELKDPDAVPFNTHHLISLYVDFCVEQLQGIKVH